MSCIHCQYTGHIKLRSKNQKRILASLPCPMCNKKPPVTVAKGSEMPRTVEHYQANAIRDQELILEQRDEIRRLKAKINKLEQREHKHE